MWLPGGRNEIIAVTVLSRYRPPFSPGVWLNASGRRLGRVLLGACAVTLVGAIAVLAWVRQTVPVANSARIALDSDEAVIVSITDWLVFRPRDGDPVTGLVFYPAARAAPVAYAPLLRALAARGHLVVLCPMPLNLALFATDCATRVMPRFREIRHWVVGGHGLGGTMAAEFVARHPGNAAGLVLWAAMPAWYTDLATQDIPVLLAYGGRDPDAAPEAVAAARLQLPVRTVEASIPDADRWSFGAFAAAVRHEDQQAILLDATDAFLQAMAPLVTPLDERGSSGR